MNFIGERQTQVYRQRNLGSPQEIFPLLCPVREKDWLDGWDYHMIYSDTGVAEKNAVFHTEHHGREQSTWIITRYDPPKNLGMVRVTPGEHVAMIDLQLTIIEEGITETLVEYQYTGLNPRQNEYIRKQWSTDFASQMDWWEKSINHYLKTGEKLVKP